jgi:PAS domain S-box-containing protein
MKFNWKRLWMPVEILISAAVALTLYALRNWLNDTWELTAFRVDLLPMAPTTGLVILLLCLTTLLVLSSHKKKGRQSTIYFLLGILDAYCLYVIILKAGNLGLSVVDRLIAGDHNINSIPVGTMSPVSALVAILTSISLFSVSAGLKVKLGLRLLGFITALLNILFCVTMAFSYAAGMPIFYGDRALPMALFTALAFLLLNLAVLGMFGTRGWMVGFWSAKQTEDKSKPGFASSGTIFLFLAMSIVIAGGGYVFLERAYKSAQQTASRELVTIGDLKAEQINRWYVNHIDDANQVWENNIVQKLAVDIVTGNSDAYRHSEVAKWMLLRQKNYQYHRFVLFDKSGKEILNTISPKSKPESGEDSTFAEVIKTNRILVTDLHEDMRENPHQSPLIHMNIWVPVSIDNKPAVGAWLIQLNPSTHLYPLILSWPTYSKTGETLLIRKEGNEVVYLNELKKHKNAAFSLRFDINKYNALPAVKAVQGKIGIVEGMDYRNAPVLAAVRPVPDTPWYIVAKIDRNEIYGPLRARTWTIWSFVCILIAMVALGVGYRERERDKQWLERQFTLSREREQYAERFKKAFITSPDSITITRARDGKVLLVNQGFLQMSGYSEEEAMGSTTLSLNLWVHKSDRDYVVSELRNNREVRNFETDFTGKDGVIRGLMSSTLLDMEGEPHILSIIRDITERFAAENLVRASEERFRSVFNNSPLGKSMTQITGEMKVNRTFCDILGYTEAELLSKKWMEITHPDDVQESKDVIAKLLNGEAVRIKYEKRYIHKDGHVVWADISTTLQRDADNKPLYFITSISDITAAKQAALELRETKDFLEKLFTYANAPIIVWNPDLTISRFNSAFERLTGLAAGDVIGKQIDLLFPAASRAESMQKIISTGSGEFWQAVEIPILHKDGSVRIALWNSANILADDNKTLVATLAQGQDITDRYNADIALRVSEEDLKESQRIAKVGSWRLDVATNQVTWTDELYRMYDFDPTLPPPPYTEHQKLFTNESWERLSTALANTVKTGVPYEVELETVRKDGSNGWMWAYGETICDATGKTIGLHGAAQDISERKQAENTIRQNVSLLQATLESTTDGILVVSDSGQVTSFNQSFIELWRIPEPIIETKDDKQLIDYVLSQLKDPEQFLAGVEQLYADKAAHSFDTLDFKDGRVFERYSQPQLIDNVPVGRVWCFRDVTQRRKDEAEIKALNESLEQKVTERTAQMTVAMKELEAFSHSVSHDLRAPLRGIDGWSMALLEDYHDKLDDKGKSNLETIRAEAQHMGKIIEALLNLSKMSRGDMELKETDLSQLAETVIKRLKTDEPERHVNVVIQPEMMDICDNRLMEIALTNLLGNAFKFTQPKANAQIEFGKTQVGGKNAYYIKDNGVGFDMAHVDKLFGTFQRLHKITDFTGTGIGLATVKRIISRHGGSIWAKAEPDKYAIFYFTLREE